MFCTPYYLPYLFYQSIEKQISLYNTSQAWGLLVFCLKLLSHILVKWKPVPLDFNFLWRQLGLFVMKMLCVCFKLCALYVCKVKVKSLSPVQLCNPMDCSPPGSSIHRIFQARVLECVAISFSRGSSQLRDWTQVSCITGRHFNISLISLEVWEINQWNTRYLYFHTYMDILF